MRITQAFFMVTFTAVLTADRFVVNEGVVLDRNTGLEWLVGPDMDMDWTEANGWVSVLEGGWRIPSQSELQNLFDAGVVYDNWGFFQNGGVWVWYAETDCSLPPGLFDFDGHRQGWFYPRSHATYERVFAVRSALTPD
jgi:hypothetical protein